MQEFLFLPPKDPYIFPLRTMMPTLMWDGVQALPRVLGAAAGLCFNQQHWRPAVGVVAGVPASFPNSPPVSGHQDHPWASDLLGELRGLSTKLRIYYGERIQSKTSQGTGPWGGVQRRPSPGGVATTHLIPQHWIVTVHVKCHLPWKPLRDLAPKAFMRLVTHLHSASPHSRLPGGNQVFHINLFVQTV